MSEHRPSAAIYGCSGLTLTEEEAAFFRQHNPLGLILFSRNIESEAQVRALIVAFMDCITHDQPLILVDQEGGRVARFKAPNWPAMPAAQCYLQDAGGKPDNAALDVKQAHQACGTWLARMGVNVNCAPMLDVRFDFSDDIIGDRAFSDDPSTVATLGKAAAEGLLAAGVMPVIKHLPGHGRATLDSHKALPVVHAAREELLADAAPFMACAAMPLGMTAHIVYTALDETTCATLSAPCIDFIRRELGFNGLLMTDDLSMHALSGSFEERAKQALAAGCDVILHCNGKMAEMQAIAGVTPVLQRDVPGYFPVRQAA